MKVSTTVKNNSIKAEYEESKLLTFQAADFFTNSKPTLCRIKSCEVLAKGCKEPLGTDKVTTMGSNSESISVKLN
jgi:hypothetical protein